MCPDKRTQLIPAMAPTCPFLLAFANNPAIEHVLPACCGLHIFFVLCRRSKAAAPEERGGTGRYATSTHWAAVAAPVSKARQPEQTLPAQQGLVEVKGARQARGASPQPAQPRAGKADWSSMAMLAPRPPPPRPLPPLRPPGRGPPSPRPPPPPRPPPRPLPLLRYGLHAQQQQQVAVNLQPHSLQLRSGSIEPDFHAAFLRWHSTSQNIATGHQTEHTYIFPSGHKLPTCPRGCGRRHVHHVRRGRHGVQAPQQS